MAPGPYEITKPLPDLVDQEGMIWFSFHAFPGAHPYLLGVLELDPLGGVSLELHVERFDDDGPTVDVWLDE